MEQEKIDVQHPDYAEAERLRTIFVDVCKGTDALRKKGTAYLPKFPQETEDSYNLRKTTATLFNACQKTREGLCGLVFQGEITLDEECPESIKKLAENIDQTGNHLNVFAYQAFDESFTGYCAILADAPTAKVTDLEQQRTLGLTPYLVLYKAEDIFDWEYQINPVTKKKELAMIKLRECMTVREGLFKRKEVTRFRIFHLNNGRVYYRLYEEVKDEGGKKAFIEIVPDTLIEKQEKIPVSIIGKLGDKPPLMDLAFKNIEHYQTYSDHKSILHKTCVPLFYTVNLEGEPEAIGGDVWFKLGAEGSMGFAEPSGSSIDKVEANLDTIKSEMALLGLAMMQSKKVQGDITATEKMLDSIQETSALQVRATQLKDALEQSLGFLNRYLGANDEISIELGAQWSQMVLTPEEMNTLSGLVDLGQMSLESFLWYLQKAGKLPPDVTVKDELKRITEEAEEAMDEAIANAQKLPMDPNEKGVGTGEKAGKEREPAFA